MSCAAQAVRRDSEMRGQTAQRDGKSATSRLLGRARANSGKVVTVPRAWAPTTQDGEKRRKNGTRHPFARFFASLLAICTRLALPEPSNWRAPRSPSGPEIFVPRIFPFSTAVTFRCPYARSFSLALFLFAHPPTLS